MTITTAMTTERVCRICQVSFSPELLEIGFPGYQSQVPRFGPCCSKDCEDALLRPKPVVELRPVPADPEAALKAAGFDDPELFGKHLGNFERSTERLEGFWQLSAKFAGQKGSGRLSLALLGATGRGKTHLARGIARSWLRQGRDVRYVRLQPLIERCKGLMDGSQESPEQFIGQLCRFKGLLILDELGRSAGNTWDTNQVVYPLMDRCRALPTVVISNFTLGELEFHYDAAIPSRLNCCEVVFFSDDMEDFRRR